MSVSRLHFVTRDLPGASHAQLVEAACLGGVRWVQYRTKRRRMNDWIAEGRDVLAVCRKFDAIMIVNDSPRVAVSIGADGVHLGRGDPPPEEARALLGPHAIIGGTVNTLSDIDRLVDAGVDYLGLGPFRFTRTKEAARLAPILGREGVRRAVLHMRRYLERPPMLVIGGIVLDDVASILSDGAHGVAVSSSIARAPDIGEAAAGFVGLLDDLTTLIELNHEAVGNS